MGVRGGGKAKEASCPFFSDIWYILLVFAFLFFFSLASPVVVCASSCSVPALREVGKKGGTGRLEVVCTNRFVQRCL